MPLVTFELGNMIYQNDFTSGDFGTFDQNTEHFLPVRGSPDENFEDLQFQPGIFKGWQLFVGHNTLPTDLMIQLGHRIYDVGTNRLGSVTWQDLPPAIPAGFTGYICFDPALTAVNLRSWAARDMIEFRWQRGNSSGTLRDVTMSVMYEFTEQYMLDNDFFDREPNANREIQP